MAQYTRKTSEKAWAIEVCEQGLKAQMSGHSPGQPQLEQQK